MAERRFEITPRPVELGGGWRLRLLEDGEEVGGGVFPLPEYEGSDDPAREAHAEAMQAGEDWASR